MVESLSSMKRTDSGHYMPQTDKEPNVPQQIGRRELVLTQNEACSNAYNCSEIRCDMCLWANENYDAFTKHYLHKNQSKNEED